VTLMLWAISSTDKKQIPPSLPQHISGHLQETLDRGGHGEDAPVSDSGPLCMGLRLEGPPA
jgi:hypothetical protein